MKHSIVEVIAYLLEASALKTVESTDDNMTIKQELEEAGFAKDVVASAFDWIRDLIEQQDWYAANFGDGAANDKTLRIFNPDESIRIGLEVRNFILSLEQVGILDTKMREIAISQLMQLKQSYIDIIDAKWVVLLVIMSKSNRNIDDIRGYLLATMALKV